MELADWIPSVLAAVETPAKIIRGVCCASHKALYEESWGGLPDKNFLALLDPKLAALRDRLYEKAYDASASAGALSQSWAAKLGLPANISIAIGQGDVHYGAVGCGVADGALVKVIGTSTCDCAVVPAHKDLPDIPGICGIVRGSILPGFYGLEAGVKPKRYPPVPSNQKVYYRLCALYGQLHDAFGGLNRSANLSQIMKELLAIKTAAGLTKRRTA